VRYSRLDILHPTERLAIRPDAGRTVSASRRRIVHRHAGTLIQEGRDTSATREDAAGVASRNIHVYMTSFYQAEGTPPRSQMGRRLSGKTPDVTWRNTEWNTNASIT
jgi:hypothetical protein